LVQVFVSIRVIVVGLVVVYSVLRYWMIDRSMMMMMVVVCDDVSLSGDDCGSSGTAIACNEMSIIPTLK